MQQIRHVKPVVNGDVFFRLMLFDFWTLLKSATSSILTVTDLFSYNHNNIGVHHLFYFNLYCLHQYNWHMMSSLAHRVAFSLMKKVGVEVKHMVNSTVMVTVIERFCHCENEACG